MGMRERIKKLERMRREADPEPLCHTIIYRPEDNDVDALIADYRKKGGDLRIFAMPAFNKSSTEWELDDPPK
jgi:hypothetical protein